VADLNINLVVAAKDAASKALGDINKSLGKIGDAAKGVGAKLVDFGKAAVAGAAIAGAAIGALIIGKAIPAAADLNEQISKNTVVFGESSAALIEWSKTTAAGLGISQAAALTATGTFGNLFRAIGITEQPAADMSQAMVQLAADMASFNNASPEEVLEALRSGLVGETEPLRRFGINLNDAALREEALRLGLVKTTNEVLPPAAKAQAAYSLIMQQSALAQGDFARTSDSVANQQRIFAATVEDSMAKIGAAFLPLAAEILPILTNVITTLADTISKDIIPAIQKWFAENEPLIRQVMDFAGNVMGAVASFITGTLVPAIASVIEAIGAWFEENKPLIDQVIAFASEVIPQVVDGIVGAVQFLIDAVSPIIGAIGELFGAMGELITEVFGDMEGEGIDLGAVLGAVFGTIAEVIKTVAGVITTVIRGVADFIRQNKETIAGILTGLANAFRTVFGIISNVVGAVFGAAGSIGKFIGDTVRAFNNLVTFFTGMPGRIGRAVTGIWNGIWQSFRAAINTVIRFWNNLGFTLGPIDLGPLGRLGPWSIGTPNIPYMAHGGVLPAGGVGIVGEAGPELIMAGSNGATVIPLDRGSPGDLSPVELVFRIEEREIFRLVDKRLYYLRPTSTRLAPR
jgi:phage-related protein